ncbi:hypothetical protein A0H81_08200 [Grifola frondosa]|uniref:Uncharacterized protein n=1 Tax=Grifola frondosa TaxID=5627 RepID=A0A1C7M4C0_GRIFR|nr:hypothetical protein A0H81_08200 [Grifola frondosa]
MDDDEFVGEEDEGGIKFTFTPPPSFYEDTSAPDVPSMPVPTNSSVSESAGEAEDNSSFMFPQLHSPQRAPGYSSIPRFTPPKPSSLPVHVFSTSTPVKIPLYCAHFHPAATGTAGSPFKTPTPPGSNKVASFIPQPRRIASPASARPSAIPVMNSTSRLPSSTLTNLDMSSLQSPLLRSSHEEPYYA